MKEMDSKRPKKALSAYMIFVRETRPLICEKYPDMHALDVMKEVGKTWQRLTFPEKQRFENEALRDKERYIQELKAFEEACESFENHIENSPENEESKSEIFDDAILDSPIVANRALSKDSKICVKKAKSQINKKMRKSKSGEDNPKPKRPLSAYIFFSQEVSSV